MAPVPPRQLYEMTAHLLLSAPPFSRNKNYEAHKDPRFKAAIALYRRLRALAADLERAKNDGSMLVILEEVRAGRPSVRVEIIGERSRHKSWLDRPAWDVLLLHPGARAAVDALSRKQSAA